MALFGKLGTQFGGDGSVFALVRLPSLLFALFAFCVESVVPFEGCIGWVGEGWTRKGDSDCPHMKDCT